MIRIGIIGAENTHTIAIAKTINIDKKIEDCQVVAVWGETKELAEEAKRKGQIPLVVNDPLDLMGKVDAVVVDHRDGKYHLPAAIPFVKQRIPVFIDKPLCCNVQEGREFFKLARKYKTPITSFSIVSLQQSFLKFKEELPSLGELSAGITIGPVDIRSEYSGIFFYGIHQVELLVDAFGYEITHAQVNLNGDYSTGTLFYSNGFIVTLNLLKYRVKGFHIMAVGEKGVLAKEITYDEDPFLTGLKLFIDMVKTGKEPKDYSKILASVAILSALQKSIDNNGAKIALEEISF